MLVHIVTFTWKPGTTAEQVEAVGRGLERLAIDLGDVLGLRHGPDLRLREGNGDYALVMSFADEAAWRRHQAHPAHKAFVRDTVAPLRAGSAAIQIAARDDA